MTEFGTAEDFANYLKTEREEVILRYDLDFVWGNCGPERTGKSTLALYVGCVIDPEFCIEKVSPRMLDYLKTLKKTEYFGGPIKRGSFLVKDESTDTYAREFYSKANIHSNKVFITSGCLNQMHCIISPKPIALDQYLREERMQIMTYSYYVLTGQPPVIQRYCLVYLRPSINKIYKTANWHNYFWSHHELERKFKPDGKFLLGDLTVLIEQMKPGLLAAYKEKKGSYVDETIGTAIELMDEENKGNEDDLLIEAAWKIKEKKLPFKEAVDEWEQTTGMSKASYCNYKKKAALEMLSV